MEKTNGVLTSRNSTVALYCYKSYPRPKTQIILIGATFLLMAFFEFNKTLGYHSLKALCNAPRKK